MHSLSPSTFAVRILRIFLFATESPLPLEKIELDMEVRNFPVGAGEDRFPSRLQCILLMKIEFLKKNGRFGILAATLGLFLTPALWAEEEMIGPIMDTDVSDWWEGPGVSGNWFGWRDILAEKGVNFFASYTVDVFGNTTGGLKTGTNYSGLLQFGTELDLEALVGWKGASVSTTWLWLSGRDASEDLVGNFLTISNIAGFNTLRMFELWWQQNLWDDRISLRVGQLAADSEFMISDYAGVFINGTFGWPAFAYMNLPEGGPGYPMGTLGARLAFQPTEGFTFMTAVFQGNVFAQDINRHGFRYRLDATEGYTFLNEAQVRWYASEASSGLPGQFKAGIWFQSGQFADALAETTSSGNVGVYGIVDQMLFRERAREISQSEKGDSKKAVTAEPESSSQGLGFFARMAGAPADRNVVNFYLDTGLTYQGLIPSRDDDILGVGFGYAQISRGARDDLAAEGFRPVGAEMVLEVTYQARLSPWLMLQPDLQLIVNPNATQDTGNALLIGFRGQIDF